MKITFLGTGTSAGVPMICCTCAVCQSTDKRDKRLRTSIMIETLETTLVVDTGPDFRQQMLREKVSKIDGILFTHPHKDHIAGLDDVRPFNFIQGQDIHVYANYAVQQALKRDFHYAFTAEKYPGSPSITLHTIAEPPSTDASFTINDVVIQPIYVIHGNAPVLGFRFGKFTYITDASYIDDRELEKAKGTEVLIINSLRKTPKHWSHFTLAESLSIIEKIQPKRAYLIHMSHQMGLHEEVSKELPKNVFLSYDGLTIRI